jgi:hypothetical protein
MPHALQPDGSPNGYGIVSHDGQWRYAWRAAGRPASYQMAVTAPQRVRPDELRAGIPVTANVFALSPDAEVRLSLDGGPARPMRPWTGAAPNYAARLSEDREMLEEVLQLGDGEADAAERTAVGDELQAIVGPFLPEPAETGHLFRANLPDSLEVGFHTLRVDALGALGERFTAYAVLRVADKPDLVFEPGDWE